LDYKKGKLEAKIVELKEKIEKVARRNSDRIEVEEKRREREVELITN